MIYRTIHIAFLGPKGSYSHIASKQYATLHHFNQIIEHSCQNFHEIITLIKKEKEQYGILPIENSTSGSINEVYDILQTTQLFLIGEIYIPITHCILAIPNTSFHNIQTIYSHPQPFQQCSRFLNQFPNWKIIFCKSSADAMEKVSKFNHPNFAALGNAQSGKLLYGLQSLKHDLANTKNNTTRFILLGSKKYKIDANIPVKMTFSLFTDYQFDIIAKISSVLHTHNIIIQHLTIRPTKSNKRKKILFVDVQSNIYNQEIQDAVSKLQNFIPSLKILGCYPKDPTIVSK